MESFGSHQITRDLTAVGCDDSSLHFKDEMGSSRLRKRFEKRIVGVALRA